MVAPDCGKFAAILRRESVFRPFQGCAPGGSMRPSRVTRTVASLCLSLVVAVTPCLASQVRPVNLEQLAFKAGHIVAGRCTKVEVVEDRTLGIPVTLVTLQVERSLKGRGGRTLTFRMAGDAPNAGVTRRSAGVPAFTPGEELILFLYPESRAGLTSPVGLGQGKFLVRRDKAGRSVAVNGDGNRVLFKGLSPDARDRLGPRALPARAGPTVGRSELLEMVADLLPRGERR